MTGHGTFGHQTSDDKPGGEGTPAPHREERPSLTRLKKNAEFRRVAKGTRLDTRAFSLQAARRADVRAQGPRVGFTVTRKTGSAVERNRMRRRLKEALRLAPALCAAPDYDYVLIIRRAALSAPFAELIGELARAFRDIANRRARRPRAEQQPPGRAAS